MNPILQIFLAVGGIALVVYSRKLAPMMYIKTQMPFYTLLSEFGLRWFKSKTFEKFLITVNRWGLVFGGLVLIFMAYAITFGPINL